MAVIFLLSAQPHLPSASSIFWDAILKKASHMLEYAVLAALIWFALGKRAPLLVWSLAAAYAVSDEYHQSFVPGRQADPMDVLLDVTGAALAVLLLRWRISRRCVSQQARRRDAAP
jgi:VanZ family protein